MAQQFDTLVDLYENSVRKYANNPLFGVKKDGAYSWITYREFGEQVDAFRGALELMGVGAGDTVAVISDNRVEWAVAAYATYGRGAAYCPMYEAQLVKDWEFIINDSGAKLLIVANEEIYEKTQPLLERIDTLERVIFFDGDDAHEDSYASLMAQGADNPSEIVRPSKDDLAGFIYTSGTTGEPKGVLLSHANVAFNVQAVLEIDMIRSDDVSLAFLPWAHSFGQNAEMHVMFALGAAMGLVESVQTIIQNLGEVRPTMLFAVPRIFNRIYDGLSKKMEEEPPLKQKLFSMAMANSDKLREEKERNSLGLFTSLADKAYDRIIFEKVRDRFGGRLRACISGGAALSPEVARFIDNLHIEVFEGYGLTETSPLVSVNTPGNRKIGSVGRPVKGVEVVVKDVEGYPSGTGEICVRGPNVMQGYHELPEKTKEVIDDEPEGRLFHTGDLGRLDEDGFLWILGRVKEQYKLENGKYVVPAPIEEQLTLSPYILQCMIEGTNKPHNVAVVVLDTESVAKWCEKNGVNPDNMADSDEVKELIREEVERVGSELKGYERPKKFALLTEEWTTENGMLTPKMSLKRRVAMERYGDMIESLYDKRR